MPMIDDGENFMGKRITIDNSGSTKVHVISAINSKKTDGGEILSVALSDADGYTTVRDIMLSRLTELPSKPTAEDSPYKGIGSISATQDEATEWFVFLMLQAGALFQAMPTDARSEVERLLKARGCPDLDKKPTLAYFDEATKLYSRLEGDD